MSKYKEKIYTYPNMTARVLIPELSVGERERRLSKIKTATINLLRKEK